MRFSCLTYNLGGGDEQHADAIGAVLQHAKADVVALVEANHPERVKAWAKQLGMAHVWERGSGTNHVAALSRFPITASHIHRTPPLTQAALEVTLQLPKLLITIYSVHFLPYLLLPFEIRRWQAVGQLLSVIRQHPPGPHLIVGDLNAIAPGDRVLQQRNPARMRRVMALQLNIIFRLAIPRLLRAGYVDCFRRLHPTAEGYTWMPHNRTTRYDYIFADATLAPALRACRVIDDVDAVNTASDHLPILAEFDLTTVV
jgi:exodeoxyribonuclease-3